MNRVDYEDARCAMRVLVAMSGGVDSSVAAARLLKEGHEVVGATLKMWGGPSDSGCCSVGDVEDARRVAQQLGIDHHVFNMTAEFDESVVSPYVTAHAVGKTPNPCIECNRSIKFGSLLTRTIRLGFDALATGHHARIATRAVSHGTTRSSGSPRLLRGVDIDKDQSYVLSMLDQDQLSRVLLPIGEMTKTQVRSYATDLGLRTAGKPDSQDVCFISGDHGRKEFLSDRIPLHEAELLDVGSREVVGHVQELELVTVGQRKGMGHSRDGRRRYVLRVDVPLKQVIVGGPAEAQIDRLTLDGSTVCWVSDALPSGSRVFVQVSAHGRPACGTFEGDDLLTVVTLDRPQRPVAPGQTVAFYDIGDPDLVLGSAIAT